MPVNDHSQSKQDAAKATAISRRPERRRSTRDGVSGEPSRTHLIALIVGTYAEMPGLSLYVHQAARLFGLREATCRVVLRDLVAAGRLRQSSDGQYRASGGSA
jgi:hypothetical protein